ncbi:DUF4232 domain-containing protein [Streptomyces sp. Pv4-95]|uniref:DUF4232 domain-containing protein n=1 Tax=Streptomyces sp. Pv4-95 TaxID=3049543 RepID=UPI0038928EFB
MTARRSRRRSAAYAALALGLAGSLALTGCNSHSKKSKSKKTSSSSTSKSKKRKIIGGGGAAAGAGAGAASHRTTDCKASATKLGVTHRPDPSRLVITYDNRSSTPCYLYYAPVIRLDRSEVPLQPLHEESAVMAHRATVPAHGRAFAVIPTNTAATKGSHLNTMDIRFSDSHGDPRALSADIGFSKYQATVAANGKAKVGEWYTSQHLADLKSGTDK